MAEYEVPTVAKQILNRPDSRIEVSSRKSVSLKLDFSTLAPPSSVSEATSQPLSVTASTVAGDRPVADALTANHPQGIDAIVYLVGDQQLLAATARHVRDGGHAISIAFGITPELADGSRITARNYGLQRKQDLLGRVGGALAAQRIRAELEASGPRRLVGPVLDQLTTDRAGGVRGKTVIRI